MPDLPFVNWKYVNDHNREVIRNNPLDYTDAIDIMLKVLQNYKNKFKPGPTPPQPDIDRDRQKIISLFTQIQDKDGVVRDTKWIQKINQGEFKCCTGHERTEYYSEEQARSWWKDVETLCPWSDMWKHPIWYSEGYRQFNEAFMTCNYKLFQDALKSHLYYVSKILFPKYDICAL